MVDWNKILLGVESGLNIAGQLALPGISGVIVKVATLGVHIAEEVGKSVALKGEDKKNIAIAIASDTVNAIATARGITVNTSELMTHLSSLIEEAVWIANFTGDFVHA